MSQLKQKLHYWAIIPAAGSGKRMQSLLPKQYLKILDKSVIEYTIESLLEFDFLHKLIVCFSEQDRYQNKIEIFGHPKIIKAIGGEQRYISVLNGLKAIENQAQDDDWVIVHDAVRPLIGAQDFNNLTRSLISDSVGGILASPVCDTMKLVDHHFNILKTENRENVFHALTPQMFRYKKLKRSLEVVSQENYNVTDESSAMEYAGYIPKIVIAKEINLKITYPIDLKITELLIKNKSQYIE